MHDGVNYAEWSSIVAALTKEAEAIDDEIQKAQREATERGENHENRVNATLVVSFGERLLLE